MQGAEPFIDYKPTATFDITGGFSRFGALFFIVSGFKSTQKL
jgi:hypothetical protein